MTQHIKIEFDQAWRAVKFVQEGGELYAQTRSLAYKRLDCVEALQAHNGEVNLFVIKPTDWRERLDGMVENGVLCWVWDVDEKNGTLSVVVRFYAKNHYPYETRGCTWKDARPLTRAEIMALADNAPG